MSPLLRDELRIVVAPEQVVLVLLERMLTRRGLVRRIKAKAVADCAVAADGEALWDAAIRTLDAELPKLIVRKTIAKVILSNHFMRYTLVPWSETLSKPDEEEAYARHCFRQLYGEAAEQWELRLSPDRAGFPQLASALDGRLPTALRGAFERHNVALDSIQPLLMAAYNNCRATLEKHNGWFVMYEPGCLCLALLQHGHWSSARTMRIGSDETLSLALERETYLAEAGTAINEVFLWAPERGEWEMPECEQWQIRNLNPVVPPAFVPEYEERFAMALSGGT